MNADVLIVGAGLSGLYAAHLLKMQNKQSIIVEARSRAGGRVQSELSATNDESGLDMGPSWFWPWQSRMLNVVRQLGLDAKVYEQHSEGVAIVEYRTGRIVEQSGTASMAGSLRLAGGLQTLVLSLQESIGNEHIYLNHKVIHLKDNAGGIEVTTKQHGVIQTFNAKRIVLAAPPRVLAESIVFIPAMEAAQFELMKNTPTWMAGQAKFVAVYETAFWRKAGLSGDGVSEIGPLGEIHDASALNGAPFALFGFVGVPAIARKNKDKEIILAAIEQLTRMYGTSAANPINVYYKDWARDNLTATDADRSAKGAHAHQTVKTHSLWNKKLYWAGSETASISNGENGYLEGALAAAERAVDQIIAELIFMK